MSTLRDYILDHRCPNCGVEMQRKPPKKMGIEGWLCFFMVTWNAVVALTAAFSEDYAKASFFLVLALFLLVANR